MTGSEDGVGVVGGVGVDVDVDGDEPQEVSRRTITIKQLATSQIDFPFIFPSSSVCSNAFAQLQSPFNKLNKEA
ncbi:MAG: hypothetical protein ABIH70_05100 [Chloroflexota bacterium]